MSQGISYGGIENKKQASANTSIASNYSHFHAPARTNQISDGTAVNNTGEKDHSQTATDTVTDTGTDGYLYEYAVQLAKGISSDNLQNAQLFSISLAAANVHFLLNYYRN